MAQFLSVKTDVEKAQKALEGTSKSLDSVSRQIVGVIAKGTVKQIKAVILATTTKRTGELSKAYRYKVKKGTSEANVYPKALNSDSTIFPKAMTLSYGHSGPTKRDKYDFNIKALKFVQSGQTYVESGAYSDDVEKVIEKDLKKYWG